jgi:hypothetical protein
MLEDAIVMHGVMAVRHEPLVRKAAAFRRDYSREIELYEDLAEEDRIDL